MKGNYDRAHRRLCSSANVKASKASRQPGAAPAVSTSTPIRRFCWRERAFSRLALGQPGQRALATRTHTQTHAPERLQGDLWPLVCSIRQLGSAGVQAARPAARTFARPADSTARAATRRPLATNEQPAAPPPCRPQAAAGTRAGHHRAAEGGGPVCSRNRPPLVLTSLASSHPTLAGSNTARPFRCACCASESKRIKAFSPAEPSGARAHAQLSAQLEPARPASPQVSLPVIARAH